MENHGSGTPLRSQWIFTALLGLVCLSSCGEEDRIVHVYCESPSANNISLDFAGITPEVEHFVQLNAQGFSPGMILELTPGIEEKTPGVGRVAYVVKPRADGYLAAYSAPLIGRLHARFRVAADSELKDLMSDVERRIGSDSYIMYYGARRQTLRDPTDAVNDDDAAVEILKEASPRTRFAVVSAVWSGGHALGALDVPGPFIAANTWAIGSYYLHFAYKCSTLSDFAAAHTGLLFSYLPVRYDRAANAVVSDSNPLDTTKFDFEPAELASADHAIQ